jgi:hypothetical protein
LSTRSPHRASRFDMSAAGACRQAPTTARAHAATHTCSAAAKSCMSLRSLACCGSGMAPRSLLRPSSCALMPLAVAWMERLSAASSSLRARTHAHDRHARVVACRSAGACGRHTCKE